MRRDIHSKLFSVPGVILGMRLFFLCIMGFGLLLAVHAEGQTNDYRAIFERNIFGLKPNEHSLTLTLPEPAGDLLLIGLAEYDGRRQALFTVIQPGKPPINFNLREGQQNDWLEVKSIQVREETIKVVLKKPSNQSRNVGVELVLSMQENRIKQRALADNVGKYLGNRFKYPNTQ